MKLLLENWRQYLNEEKDLSELDSWEHEDAKEYAKKLIEDHGEPDVVTGKMVLWEDGISEFDKVYVKDESIEHDSPKPHRDYVYSTMTIDVPEELMEAVAKASESIIVDQLKNEVTARCGDITANAITLGFVQKLVDGEIKPEDAAEEYKRHILDGIKPDWFKEQLNEKDDRCTRIAKQKYDVWPSAYASGAVVKCRKGKIWKDLKEEELTDDEEEELKTIENELDNASKMHKSQSDRIKKITKEAKKKKAGTESSKESSLHDWFGRKGAKGKSKGWVDCNTCRKDKKTGKKTCKSCGRQKGEKRTEYPSCRPTPAACGEKGKGKSWGKKSKGTNEVKLNERKLKELIQEEIENMYYEVLAEGEILEEAEYQGRKVTLNKPMKGDVKKSKVYVKNAKGNVVKVNFGDPNMRIKKNIPARRKSFRARHNCKNPGPKWKARYWSCKAW